jgi:hypothetical protein
LARPSSGAPERLPAGSRKARLTLPATGPYTDEVSGANSSSLAVLLRGGAPASREFVSGRVAEWLKAAVLKTEKSHLGLWRLVLYWSLLLGFRKR